MNKEINLGGGNNMIVTTSKLVSLHETLTVIHDNKSVQLDIKIEADFNSIPELFHEIFFNVMTSKYSGAVSFGDNPFSQCVPITRKRWWQFWK
jgi:hypothetical protein